MIEYISGPIADLRPTSVVIDCHGIGYLLEISLTTYGTLKDQKSAKLFVSEVIREDSYQLYGFTTDGERDLFLKLTSVSGVGPATARMILSSFAPQDLVEVISLGKVEELKRVKGIGQRTAQRILVDLKGKIDLEVTYGGDSEGVDTSAVSNHNKAISEATTALKLLGFADANIRKVLKTLTSKDPTLGVEQLIKQALRHL
ncbi:Holliday junction branch migration protein RuvA [Falsiporphyromonas endometrii]|uniref:Holliday junction branch migration complex subunit RuvA n=1 Tax=Falsiporphyromonas endometrii TaxID=1387297 RepID=A0ABV9K9S9_9PORP